MGVLHVPRIARDISHILNVDQLTAYGDSLALAPNRSWGSCKKQNKLCESLHVFYVKSRPPVPNADDEALCAEPSIERNADCRSWRIEPDCLIGPGLNCGKAECSGPVILVMHGKLVLHGEFPFMCRPVFLRSFGEVHFFLPRPIGARPRRASTLGLNESHPQNRLARRNPSAVLPLRKSKHVETIFSTRAVHPRDRFDYWHSTACKQIVDHAGIPEDRSTFDAEIQAAKFGNLELVQFRVSPIHVFHTPEHVRRTCPDDLFLCYQSSGSAIVVQNAREVRLDAGNLMLIEPLLPYECRFAQGSTMLVIKAPRRELRARLGRNRELTGRRVTAQRVDDDLAISLAAKLPSLAGKIASITEEMVGSHALDLLGLAIARTTESSSARISTTKALVLGRLRSAVEARLADPDLDAQTVADAVGISVRYANDLLSAQDTSLNRFILSRRLARCRYALEDPNQAFRTVSEIAQEWGFSDMTHFGRCFKAAYEVSPREYQKARRGFGE